MLTQRALRPTRLIFPALLLTASGCFFDKDPKKIVIEGPGSYFNERVESHFEAEVSVPMGLGRISFRSTCPSDGKLQVESPSGGNYTTVPSVKVGAGMFEVTDPEPGMYRVHLANSEPCMFAVFPTRMLHPAVNNGTLRPQEPPPDLALVRQALMKGTSGPIYHSDWTYKEEGAPVPADMAQQILGTWVQGVPPLPIPGRTPEAFQKALASIPDQMLLSGLRYRFEANGVCTEYFGSLVNPCQYQIQAKSVTYVKAGETDQRVLIYEDGALFTHNHEMGPIPLFKMAQ
jgi:hypothetical protein